MLIFIFHSLVVYSFAYRDIEEVSIFPASVDDPRDINKVKDKWKRTKMQESYTINVWGNPITSANANIAYGYILYAFKKLKNNDNGALKALTETWGYITGTKTTLRWTPKPKPWSGMLIKDITIKEIRGQELRYSGDGDTWANQKFGYLDENFNQDYLEYKITMGVNYFISFSGIDNNGVELLHNVTISYDREQNYNLFSHSFKPMSSLFYNQKIEYILQPDDNTVNTNTNNLKVKPLRILTYNTWNTSPPIWFLQGERRWKWYMYRMSLMAKYVKDCSPDIIVFQEVRYDEGIGPSKGHSQIDHITHLLPEYQYVYQPANMYVERGYRIEEGVLILSLHPIVTQEYILLSRNPQDPQDDHQRLVLRAGIQTKNYGRVYVYGTHLALSEPARDRTVQEIYHYMKNFDPKNKFMHVLCGDLNAEPDSKAIQYLEGFVPLNGEFTDLKDAWLQLYPEPTPRSTDTKQRHDALTFPTDNPVKRIDFVIYRARRIFVEEAKLIGQDAYPGTETNRGDGMLSIDSPIYASDHRGLYVDFSY
ncbi:hypothetical protein WA158_000898 [Blastocystis sp. Blastoise]